MDKNFLTTAFAEWREDFKSEIINAVTAEVTAKVLASINANTIKSDDADEWITQKQVCQRYRISLTTINRRQHEGIFKPKYIGRKALYRVQDIENYLNGDN